MTTPNHTMAADASQLDCDHESSRRGVLDAFALLALLLVACALPACKSYSPSRYISPRVEGRVLDAQSLQPVADVQMRWLMDDERGRGLG